MNHQSDTHNYIQPSEYREKISKLLAFLSELRKLENESAGSFEFHRLKEAIEADIYTLIEAMNSEIECGSVQLQSTDLTARPGRINVEENDASNSSLIDSGGTFFHQEENKDDQSTELIANVSSGYRRENVREESFSSSGSSGSEESDSISESDSDSIEYYSDSYSDSNSDSFEESYSSSD